MSNGEIQPDKNKKDLPIRKSRIRKAIERTLSTAKYEGIVIREEIEEDIEWQTLEEWNKKQNNWTIMLIKRFKETHDQVLQELSLEHKKAFFKDYIAEKDNRPEPGEPSPLDDLDTLD